MLIGYVHGVSRGAWRTRELRRSPVSFRSRWPSRNAAQLCTMIGFLGTDARDNDHQLEISAVGELLSLALPLLSERFLPPSSGSASPVSQVHRILGRGTR